MTDSIDREFDELYAHFSSLSARSGSAAVKSESRDNDDSHNALAPPPPVHARVKKEKAKKTHKQHKKGKASSASSSSFEDNDDKDESVSDSDLDDDEDEDDDDDIPPDDENVDDDDELVKELRREELRQARAARAQALLSSTSAAGPTSSAPRLVVSTDGSVQAVAVPRAPPPVVARKPRGGAAMGAKVRVSASRSSVAGAPGGRVCIVPGCGKWGQTPKAPDGWRCVRHGGGRRCRHDGCASISQGSTGLCTLHGGGARSLGARPRKVKSNDAPDVFFEAFQRTRNMQVAREVAIAAASGATVAFEPLPTLDRAAASEIKQINPLYLKLRRKHSSAARSARKSAVPQRNAGAGASALLVWNAARYAQRRGLAPFVSLATAVADDDATHFAAKATHTWLASLSGAPASFQTSPFVCAPYGSSAAFERLLLLDKSTDGAPLPLFRLWAHRLEFLRVSDDRHGGPPMRGRYLARNLRVKAEATRVEALLLPDEVEPIPGFLANVTTPAKKKPPTPVPTPAKPKPPTPKSDAREQALFRPAVRAKRAVAALTEAEVPASIPAVAPASPKRPRLTDAAAAPPDDDIGQDEFAMH